MRNREVPACRQMMTHETLRDERRARCKTEIKIIEQKELETRLTMVKIDVQDMGEAMRDQLQKMITLLEEAEMKRKPRGEPRVHRGATVP